MIKVLDLFSGIGGFAYASERIVGGFETVAFCEIDPFCQKVLKKNFPGVPIHNDIKELEKNAIRYRGYVDVVCGGFPCQPWSNAGKKEGHEDKKGRDLWGEMASIIKQILPRFVIGENVRGFAQMPMGLQRSVNDLESIGYRVANFIIPSAYALGLPHKRERCWIIAEYVGNTNDSSDRANRTEKRKEKVLQEEYRQKGFPWLSSRTSDDSELVADTECMGWEERSEVRETFEGKRWSNNTCNGSFANGEKDNVANSNSKGLQRYRKHRELEGESSKNEFSEKSIQNTQTKDLANSEGIDRYGNEVIREHGENETQEVFRNGDGTRNTQTQIVANSNGIRQQRSGKTIRSINPKKDKIRKTSRSDDASKGQRSIRKSFLRMGNVADGISERLGYDYTIEPGDLPRVVKGEKQRADKLKALGNSIIPQCVAVFFQSIKDCYCEHDR